MRSIQIKPTRFEYMICLNWFIARKLMTRCYDPSREFYFLSGLGPIQIDANIPAPKARAITPKEINAGMG